MGTKSIIIKSEKYGDMVCLFDETHEDLVKSHKWHLQPNAQHTVFYATSNKGALMHRLITEAPKGADVDHINHNGLDNRLENLRVCTHKENMQNQAFRRTNTTGYSNIYYDNDGNRAKRWFFKFGRKKSKRYYSIEEAIQARDAFKRKEGRV